MQVLFINLAIVSGYFFLWWLASIAFKRASIIDIAWGLGFVVVAWANMAIFHGIDLRMLVAALLVTAWGFRLATYLGLRQWHEAAEDARYEAMRANHPNDFGLWSLYMVFGLQAAMLFLVSLPLQFGGGAAPFGLVIDYIGISIALLGLIYESVADWQLAQFKSKAHNEGSVMDQGLWAWSRHPNYFGESVFWWGVFLLTVPTSGNWWLVLAPFLITFLLLRVSGVPLLEKNLKQKRPDYAAYASRTSSFIPLPPKRAPN